MRGGIQFPHQLLNPAACKCCAGYRNWVPIPNTGASSSVGAEQGNLLSTCLHPPPFSTPLNLKEKPRTKQSQPRCAPKTDSDSQHCQGLLPHAQAAGPRASTSQGLFLKEASTAVVFLQGVHPEQTTENTRASGVTSSSRGTPALRL